jgi:S-formylglutathione hydrolase FrmB
METSEISPEGCTIERWSVPSPAMEREIKAVAVLPPEYQHHPEKRYPILYAFHGAMAPYDTFSAMIPLRQALADKPMIVASFDADAWSWYIDSPHPQKAGRDPKETALVKSLFTTFFLDEFIPCLDRRYRVDASQRMLTGFSMGGHGAFHYALVRPGEFASVSSLSGGFISFVDPAPEQEERVRPLLGPYHGNEERYAAVDLFTRIRKQAASDATFPPLYLHCGAEDWILGYNRAMRRFLKEQGVACEYRESPGDHDWPFWRDASADLIDFHWRMRPEKPGPAA